MSQKSQSDGGQKHFAVGRGLLAAAETLNFGMNEQRPNRQIGGMASGVGVGKGLEGQDSSQIIRHGSSSNLGSTMKLFASLGLSPSDLDALAKIPEEDISVETLPQILMQLKNRKGDAGERRVASSMSSDTAYRGGRDSWDDVQMGRMGGPSLGQGSARAQPSADFGYSSLQDVSSSRGYSLNYSSSGGGGSRERPYSELSHHDSYSGLGLGLPSSDPIFMQRRMGSPSNGKVQDFLGVMPPMFPHVCSLCDFDIHSTMEWTQHINGLRHAENRRLLLDMYPEWDPGMVSGRGGDLLDAPNLGAGLLGPAPMSQAAGGMSSSWGGSGGPGLSGTNQPGQIKLRSRVVVVKYDRKPLSNNTLFAFAKPFGCLMEHLVLKNKAFLEMNSHEEALDMVNYYDQHPASLYGKPLTFYLSKRLEFIEKEERQSDRPMDRPIREVKGFGSQVVFFSNLPRENEKKKELLTIAERFGTVEKHLFLTDQAFVQLGSPKDAEMLVKYYSMNPLTIKGRLIRLNICTKYKTLNVNRRQGGSGGDARNQRSSGANATTTTTTSSCSSGTKTTSSSKSSLSKASSGSRLKEENKVKPSEKPAAEEEEEASRVMKGENGGEDGKRRDEQATDGDAEGEEPERTESVMETVGESEDVQREEEEVADGVDVSDEAPGPVGGAGGEVQQGAESEGQAEASTEEHKNKDEANAELGESSEAVEGELPADMFDENFLENMEDFVTLDELAEDEDEAHTELDSIDNTRKGGMRVVNIVGFRRGYNFLNELLALAKPFGKVLKHLVLDLRPEAYLQFETEEEARAMAKFYNSNVTASVCGRPVRVNHSLTYPTIQCGSSRVVYIGQIPSSKYADDTILKLAEPFGNIKKYFLNRIKRECFIEMEKAEDAEKMAEEYKVNPPKFSGKRLTVYVSRKYRQLKHGHQCPSRAKREISSTPTKSSKHPEEPPAKKSREDMSLEEKSEEEKLEEKSKEEKLEEKREEEEEEEEMQSSDVRMEAKQEEETSAESVSDQNQNLQEEQEAEVDPSTNQSGQAEVPPPCAEPKVSIASLPLPPYNPSSPIGVEHVKMGYYCRVCFLFYSNEDTAKKTHCSSQMHYDKLQTYLEREKAKAEKKKGETTVV